MEIKDRKRVIFWVRIGLILGTVVFVLAWIGGRVTSEVREKAEGISVTKQGPSVAQLGPGDLQILTTDGNFDVTLQGNKISAGLSPKMQEQVKAEMAKESANESGLGGIIAGAAKSAVASAIGIHVSWDLANIREVRFRDGKLTIIDKDGDTHGLSESNKNGRDGKEGAKFDAADAERFIAAVNKRKAELGIP
jgi:hypothetical protein